MLATSCDRDEQNGEKYKTNCAQIIAAGVGFCPPRILIESEKPIANTDPVNGFVHFLVEMGSLPQEFRGVSGPVTVTFRLTGEKGFCFGEVPIIEILTIERCE